MKSFQEAVEDLINGYSMENESNTPDFILATYLLSCLKAFDEVTKRRDEWYGVDLYPGCGIGKLLKEKKNG